MFFLAYLAISGASACLMFFTWRLVICRISSKHLRWLLAGLALIFFYLVVILITMLASHSTGRQFFSSQAGSAGAVYLVMVTWLFIANRRDKSAGRNIELQADERQQRIDPRFQKDRDTIGDAPAIGKAPFAPRTAKLIASSNDTSTLSWPEAWRLASWWLLLFLAGVIVGAHFGPSLPFLQTEYTSLDECILSEMKDRQIQLLRVVRNYCSDLLRGK